MYKKILISSFLTLFLGIYPGCVSSTQAKPPHGIILISLDTLRADHLGVYGYHRNTSPSIDAFAKKSIVFENAVAQSAWTLPSHMSIMTSLYPSSHGVQDKNQSLAGDHLTLAELLQDGGYKTAAFADGALMRKVFGFDQGFDVYDGDKWLGIAKILPKVKKWLKKNKSNPFFLFIHCYDIHDPYTPPPPYNSIFHDFTYTGNFVPSTKNLQAAAWRGLEVNDEDLRHIKALYDGGIRYTDEKIGEFLSFLQETGLKDNSLIIITSDHGEEFKEHGSFVHWKLYFRPNLHVPFIMHIPNYPKREIRINDLVQSIDILPTILDIAELSPHQKAQGKSLLPLIKRNSTIFRRSLWRIFHPFRKDEKTSFAEHSEITGKRRHDYSIITDNYQMIYELKSKSLHLFNWKDDPLAQNNIVKDHDDISERLMSQLNEMHNVIPRYNVPTVTLDNQTREQLKALGYIDSEGDEDIDDNDLDGIPNQDDNCSHTPNGPKLGTCVHGTINYCASNDDCGDSGVCSRKQEDTDRDGKGDVCDPDDDNDGICDPGESDSSCTGSDNCQFAYNPNQEDNYPLGGNDCGDACDCIGNLDDDGEVGIRDVSLFKNNFGRKNCSQRNPCQGNFDCDGDVDDDDYLILKENLGKTGCPACEFICNYE